MKLLALVESAEHVCYRYRVRAFEPALRDAGIDVTVAAVPRSFREWPHVLWQAERADAVLLQRKLLAPWYLGSLRRAAKRLIYDIDDAVFHRDSNSAKPAQSWRRWARFRATVTRA